MNKKIRKKQILELWKLILLFSEKYNTDYKSEFDHIFKKYSIKTLFNLSIKEINSLIEIYKYFISFPFS